VHTVFCVGVKPSSSISSPTLIIRASARPVTTGRDPIC
jgi:hypothetical protein